MFRVAVISVALLLVIVIIGGVIAGVSAASKPAIHSLTVSEVAADQVLLSWEKANKVDGYRVMMAKGDADLEEYQTINDPDTVTATVTGLEQASSYRFAVTTLRGNKAARLSNRTIPVPFIWSGQRTIARTAISSSIRRTQRITAVIRR